MRVWGQSEGQESQEKETCFPSNTVSVVLLIRKTRVVTLCHEYIKELIYYISDHFIKMHILNVYYSILCNIFIYQLVDFCHPL